jgi:hypothetical protein
MSPGVSETHIETDVGELLYIWQQLDADPTTARVRNAIHFELPDPAPRGNATPPDVPRRIDNAFVYDWRLWSVAELRDALRESGFRSTEVHVSYGAAMDGEGAMLLGPPASSDEPNAETDPDAMPAPDEPAVYYVVARV